MSRTQVIACLALLAAFQSAEPQIAAARQIPQTRPGETVDTMRQHLQRGSGPVTPSSTYYI